MRIYKNDIIKASAISTGADRGVLLCSITDSGFTSIAGVVSAVKDKLPGKDHKKMIFEIRNDGRIQTYGTPGFTIVGITRTFQLGNALPRSQDRANIMFNYHLTHKWDQYYH